MVPLPADFSVVRDICFGVTVVVGDTRSMGGLEIIGPAAGTVVLAVTGCTAPILTLGEVFVEVVVEVVGGAATAMEGLVSESCRESLE